jgi:hypothetical protein
MRNRGLFLLAVAALAVSSCTLRSSPAPPLRIPDASMVSQIVVSGSTAGVEDPERALKDPETIGRFVAFLRAHNEGWSTPGDTFPSSYHTVSLQRGKDVLLVVWQGSGWIGGREGDGGASDNRLRALSGEEMTEFLQILGLPKG